MRAGLRGAIFLAGLLPAIGWSSEPGAATTLPEVEVTATRAPEPVDRVPVSVTVISGDQLRARGATDLRTALALVAGVDAPPGGDAGPPSAVPSFWGLHEFDAFLLVVDGVPWGGAFNPSIPTLDLTNVERIEVLKGAAPVTYGATAFVGVVQVIHYPAGEAADQVQAGHGSYGSFNGAVSKALPSIGSYVHSLSIDGGKQQYSDPREGISDGKLEYRGAAPIEGGSFRVDANVTLQRQAPPSPVIRQNALLVTPVDANANPADARIDEHRYNLVLGYSHATPLGLWDTTASYAHSNVVDVRGFLRADFTPDSFGDDADYQSQDRGILDTYLDSHFSKTLGEDLTAVYGADWLYGSGQQQSVNGAYFAPPNGSGVPPATTSRPVDEINGLSDRRSFIGEYAQLDWEPAPRWDLMVGLRLNEASERKTSTHIDTADATNDLDVPASKQVTRWAGMTGASYRAWTQGADEEVIYADYRNTFKPAAIDFGPDVTPAVLEPETARSYEAGVKGQLANGRLGYDLESFFLHFNNLVVATTDASGNPIQENAGSELFKGLEAEAHYRVARDLSVVLDASYHDARYGHYLSDEGGVTTDFDGKHVELSPHTLAALGWIYAPNHGIQMSATTNYIGNRWLDRANTARTPSYTTLDARCGYQWRRVGVFFTGYNLTDERKPVTESEFGDSSYYILPARSLMLSAAVKF